MSTKVERDRQQAETKLIEMIVRRGLPCEFGKAIAVSLGTTGTMNRMIGYLSQPGRLSPEEIADEMLAITSDRDRWRDKKMSEFYQHKYSEYLRFEAPAEEFDDEELERRKQYDDPRFGGAAAELAEPGDPAEREELLNEEDEEYEEFYFD